MDFLGGSLVKNLPAMQETRVQSLGWEDLEKEMATHLRILAWKSPGQRRLAGYSPRGHKELDITYQLSTHSNLWCYLLLGWSLYLSLYSGQNWEMLYICSMKRYKFIFLFQIQFRAYENFTYLYWSLICIIFFPCWKSQLLVIST